MQIACAIIFITFTYVYLAFYQADVLAVAQHVFSGGLTNYSYTLAPLLITLVLYLLQVGVYAVTRVKRRFHGLTYFPSFLVLTMITDIPVDIDLHHSLGAWWIILPLCLILWGGIDMDSPTVGTDRNRASQQRLVLTLYVGESASDAGDDIACQLYSKQ